MSGEDRIAPARFQVGDLSLALTGTGTGSIAWHGVELLRGAAYPVRDANWGTVPVIGRSEAVDRHRDGISVQRLFETADGAVSGSFQLVADASGSVEMRLDLKAVRAMMVNRAGFTLLHPIEGLAGERLEVTHADGRVEQTVFPRTIAPSQPARDIVGLRYSIKGCSIAIEFSGDVFEMEDQRNWSDASYKTYCRPLALPYPYTLETGEMVTQTLSMRLTGRPPVQALAASASQVAVLSSEPIGERVPAVALAQEEAWEGPAPGGLAGLPVVLRIDLNTGNAPVEGMSGPLDLELVTADDLDTARGQLAALSERLDHAGQSVGHVTALPRAYLKSYQPDATWPPGASPAALVAAVREAFPRARVGGGALTNFTELNRCRPDPSTIDFVTHGSSAIVHAADDTSVFQTIEALPHIFESARAIAPDVPYRLGLVSIGMRTNPYGAALADNPEGILKTTTADDPRARSRAGAAWIIAAMASTRGFAIEQIVLAAPRGPFGILDADGRVRPSFHVVTALHAMAGLPRTDRASASSGIALVSALEGTTVRALAANIGAEDAELEVGDKAVAAILTHATEAQATDPGWLEQAARPCEGKLRLSRYDIAFITVPAAGHA